MDIEAHSDSIWTNLVIKISGEKNCLLRATDGT